MTDPQIVPVAAIDPSQRYRVKLARPVTWNGHRFLPLDNHTFSGRVLLAIMQDVPDAVSASALAE